MVSGVYLLSILAGAKGRGTIGTKIETSKA